MKTILATVSAIGLLAAAPAYAADAENTVNIGATVAPACGVGNHISGNGTASGYTAGDIAGVNLDQGNGQFSAPIAFAKRSFGNLWCNAPADLTLEVASLALITDPVNGTVSRGTPPADSGSFANEFNLEVTTSTGVYLDPTNAGGNESSGQRLVLNTANGTGGIISKTNLVPFAFETGTGQYGGFDLKILPTPGNSAGTKRPVAGSYAGYVRLTATIH